MKNKGGSFMRTKVKVFLGAVLMYVLMVAPALAVSWNS
jgi:hypothetical protein